MKMQGFIFSLMIAVTDVYGQSILSFKPTASYTTKYTGAYVPVTPLFSSAVNIGPCNSETVSKDENNFLANYRKISKKLSCDPKYIQEEEVFSVNYCKMAIACKDSVLGIGDEAKKLDEGLNEIMTKDFLSKAVTEHFDKIENFEALREFAKNKLNLNVANACSSRMDLKKDIRGCIPALDKNFEDIQMDCLADKGFKKGCFYIDETNGPKSLSFKNFKENLNKSDKSSTSEYLKYRAKNIASYQSKVDDVQVEKLALLVTSDAFNQASSDSKAEMFLNIAKDETLTNFELSDIDSKLSAKEKLAKVPRLANLYEQEKLSKDSFIASFNEYRKNKITEIIKKDGDTCKNLISVNYLCRETGQLSLNKELSQSPGKAQLYKKFSKDVFDQKSISKLKDQSGNVINDSNLEILLNAKKCSTYNLTKPASMLAESARKPVDYSDDDDLRSELHTAVYGSSTSSSALPWTNNLGSSYENIGLRVDRDSVVSSNKAVQAPLIESPSFGSSSATATHEAVSNYNDNKVPTYNPVTGEAANNFMPSTIRPEYEPTAGSSRAIASASTTPESANDVRVNELTKKLAAAEESVQQMKINNEQADNERVKQKKIEEEQALITDLRSQIADLKTQSTKKSDDRSDTQASSSSRNNRREPTPDDSLSTGRAESVQRKTVSIDDYEPAKRASADYSSESGSSSKVASSSSSSSAGQSASSDKSSGASTGLVFTTVDGMSAERVSETISKRILELNGMPFYIEESGMVKEIIPVVKDGKPVLDENGKPVFEKITKGKVGDKKFAKTTRPDRAPAAITNTADLKRDQEEQLKRERAEYNKLKSLTNEIMNK
jgi:hypothetical protein